MTGRNKTSNSELQQRKVIGERLNEIIRENGISQNRLSKMLNDYGDVYADISQPTISGIVHGKRPLQEHVADAILEVLPIDEYSPSYRKEWLLGIDDYKTEGIKIKEEFLTRLSKSKGTFKKIDFHPQILVTSQLIQSLGFDFEYSNDPADSSVYISYKGIHYSMQGDVLEKCLNEIVDYANWKMNNLVSNSQKMD